MSRIRLGYLGAALLVGGVALAPGCRPISYYLSNTSFSVSSTKGSYSWTQTDSNNGPVGNWSPSVTDPSVTIGGVMGSNLTIVALAITPTFISSEFPEGPSAFSPEIIPLNQDLSAGASGSSAFTFTLSDLDSTFNIASDSTPLSPSSTVSPPTLESGGTAGNGSYEFQVVPLWKNAFDQTNFTTDSSGNFELTKAAENNDVPSPRTIVTFTVQYNLAGTGTTGSGGAGGGTGGQSNP